MRQLLFLAAISFAGILPSGAQTVTGLQELNHHSMKVYYSTGHEERAATIARRVDNAIKYYKELFHFTPQVSLYVLSGADWKQYATLPVVYGMPHYNNDKKLVVAAEDNPFWQSFVPPKDQLPADAYYRIKNVYKTEKGAVSMQAFFDLLALHELGHAFHHQAGLHMQRKWMGELFSNIMLHTYIAEKEPEQLPALTLFPQMVVSNGHKNFKYTSLQDLEQRYDEIGQQYPVNYGWYQSRWHMAAGKLYDTGGTALVQKLWTALQKEKQTFSDETLPLFFEKEVDGNLAGFIRNWDKETGEK